jgi:hypothetical protein
VRAKKATKPSRSVRYLLSADRRLQKLSLRKMSERLKQPKRRSTEAKNRVPAKLTPPEWMMGWPAVVTGLICVIGVASLIGQPGPEGDVAAALAPQSATAMVESAPVVKTVPLKPPTAVVSKMRTAAAPAAVPKPRPTEPVKAPAAESTPHDVAPQPASVTITGCVGGDGDTFWLKDASGVDAPKSRSWRSGFLTKRPSRIELIDASNSLRLSSQVGRRVAATGILMNRELRARSLRSVAASCN